MAPPAAVYRALTDADAVGRWRVPDDMTATVHELEPVEGGRIRVSLMYADPARAGKSGDATDTYSGTFVRLERDRVVVERIAFETDDPEDQGEITMTTELEPVEGGTLVKVSYDRLPAGVDPADNETGTRMALDRLAALVEDGPIVST
jgi:uncharacterized protein YndB with AHSA1/START domain